MKQVLAVAFVFLAFAPSVVPQETRQATGVKVGEVTDTSAIVWMRLTAHASRNPDKPGKPDDLKGAVPGAPGQVQLRYGTKPDLSDAKSTEVADVSADTDFAHQFRLTGLKPNTTYHYRAETSGPKRMPKHAALAGQFTTAPAAGDAVEVRFSVVTGQAFKDVDHPDGFHIYESMLKLNPHFLVLTGDTVYYDNDPPLVNSLALARYHWQRMYGFPRHIAFHSRVPGYWMKDDHDVYDNDCWPTRENKKMLPFTFKDGLRVYREQAPQGEKPYRTFRWGKCVQVVLVEGRDYRSPNTMKDGPNKTIWGEEQKRWLMDVLRNCDADWIILISPTPIVGPDRPNKNDNHANPGFATEGNWFRSWAAKELGKNFFIVCGDRHWQYHSVHPETKVREFSCGPASDKHAGGSPGEDKNYHRFHRVQGGYLSVTAGRSANRGVIVFRLHDVQGNVVYEHRETAGE
jgi:alkaline phosphatase D